MIIALAKGECPDCGGFIFRDGPCGGIAQNIECVGCGSRFNVVRYYASVEELLRQGRKTVVMAQRIPGERDGGEAWREDMFPRVLQ